MVMPKDAHRAFQTQAISMEEAGSTAAADVTLIEALQHAWTAGEEAHAV